MLTYLLCVVVFLCFLNVVFNYNRKARLLKKVPGPERKFIYGTGLEIFFLSPVESFEYLRGLAKKYSTINSLWAFPYGLVNIYEPDDVETLIASTKHNEKNLYYKFLESWLQEGLLLSHGDKWHHRRKILTPSFHPKVLKQFSVVFEENCERLVETLRQTRGDPTDVIPILSEITLHTICETAMGIKLHQKTEGMKTYIDALSGVGHTFFQRCNKVYYYPNFTYQLSQTRRQELGYANTVHNFTKSVVETKRASAEEQAEISDDAQDDIFLSKKKRSAFLDLLLSLQKDGLIDEKGIHEEVNTFMFEGHDTTSCALTCTFMLLANNKHIQKKLLDEINEILGETDKTATVDDLSEMRYLERCIKESLRLYPPVPTIGRITSEDIILSGYRVPKGIHCVINIYDIHRRADIYKDPLVFDPDRFLPENCKGRHPYAYLPFSAGPRNCIGQKFAMLEMKAVIASVLREFELQPITTPADLKFPLHLVLKCVVPVKIKFIPRKKNA